jgi:nitrite reductase/ring-hydroxylating ferredoxin subunit
MPPPAAPCARWSPSPSACCRTFRSAWRCSAASRAAAPPPRWPAEARPSPPGTPSARLCWTPPPPRRAPPPAPPAPTSSPPRRRCPDPAWSAAALARACAPGSSTRTPPPRWRAAAKNSPIAGHTCTTTGMRPPSPTLSRPARRWGLTFWGEENGEVRCLDDACPHRGAPLSGGWVEEKEGHTCVVCPYHGWGLDGSGRLLDVPAAEHPGEWPRRPVVPTHAVQERGGFVWLWYGARDLPADERPPIPHVPELDDPAWKAVYGEFEFECNHSAVFENAIDMAHIHCERADALVMVHARPPPPPPPRCGRPPHTLPPPSRPLRPARRLVWQRGQAADSRHGGGHRRWMVARSGPRHPSPPLTTCAAPHPTPPRHLPPPSAAAPW